MADDDSLDGVDEDLKNELVRAQIDKEKAEQQKAKAEKAKLDAERNILEKERWLPWWFTNRTIQGVSTLAIAAILFWGLRGYPQIWQKEIRATKIQKELELAIRDSTISQKERVLQSLQRDQEESTTFADSIALEIKTQSSLRLKAEFHRDSLVAELLTRQQYLEKHQQKLIDCGFDIAEFRSLFQFSGEQDSSTIANHRKLDFPDLDSIDHLRVDVTLRIEQKENEALDLSKKIILFDKEIENNFESYKTKGGYCIYNDEPGQMTCRGVGCSDCKLIFNTSGSYCKCQIPS